MKASRFGTICLLILLVATGFQNCAESAATPDLKVDRETVQSLTSERGQLNDETARIVALVKEELRCTSDSDCEELVVKGACETAVASARARTDRSLLLALLSQHRTDWRAFTARAERFPELSWVCPQGRADVDPVCESSRCLLRVRTSP